jgi:N-methylhydantoinase A
LVDDVPRSAEAVRTVTAGRRFNIAVDIGGTFTDCVVRDDQGGFAIDKAFTTPGNLIDGLLRSLSNAVAHVGLPIEDVLSATEAFKVGTTSPVNRLINRAGARVALLTTRGHEDAVLIGRVHQKMDGLSEAQRSDLRLFAKAEPLVPPGRIYGLGERVDSSGSVLAELREAEIEEVVRACLADQVAAFAVCLLWSFLNPRHERLVREVIGRLEPSAFVVLSSDIAPVIGEYERAATTLLNAYLGPGTALDFRSLETALAQRGLHAPVYLMQSSGGVAPAEFAVNQPVHLLGSGPVGGVAAARGLSARVKGANVIATDMGGTSFDVGVITNGRAVEVQLSIQGRYRVLSPAIEVTSIGAGGGSIARVDPLTGVLQVGPESAGSNPGPVCYGFGGSLPTVTDANAVLGRLDPERFFAGRRRLDIDAARQAISSAIAEPMGVSVEAAAMAIVDIIDSRMADLIRNLTVERGLDPRDFAVAAYGGGGPLHVGSYARDIGCEFAIIPRAAPVFSAWGIAESPVRRSFATSAPTMLPVQTSVLAQAFDELRERASAEIAGLAQGTRAVTLEIAVRYRYQLQELAVPIEAHELGRDDLGDVLVERFERMYEERYGRGTTYRAAGVEASTFRFVVTDTFGDQPAPPARAAGTRRTTDKLRVWFRDGYLSVGNYDADAAAPGFTADGPCVVAGRLHTIVVHAGQTISVNEAGDFVLRLRA